MTNIQIDIKQKNYSAKGSAKSHLAIENFKLSLDSNQFVCLVGSSGCGKTTLLNSIAGLDTDFVGEIIIGQQTEDSAQAATAKAANQTVKAKIGYVFQNPRLLPWRTVRENIELALNPPYDNPFIDSLLQTMQLNTVQNVYPERLSLGMSRRVAIIRAFVINPAVLLMDEPFVSLDPPTARQARNLLITLWQQRPHTVLFVTHDLREAIALADKLVFLSPPPMQIISQIPVPIARNNRDDESVIEAFRQQLFSDYPAISGLL